MKHKVIVASVVFLSILVIFTFVSRSVYNYNLPQVTATKISAGAITLTEEAVGTLDYQGAADLKATGTWLVDEVMVEDGQMVSQGDILCTFDMRSSDINIMTLELNVIKAQNALVQMKQNTTATLSSSFDDYAYKQAIANAETALKRKQAELLEKQAALADAEEAQLPTSVVVSVQRRQQDLQEAEDVLTKVQTVFLKAQDEKKDASVIQVAKDAVDEAQKVVTSARQALHDAQVIQQDAQEALLSGIKSAQKAVTIAQQSVDDSQVMLDNANVNLASAQDTYNKSLNIVYDQVAEAAATLNIAQAQLDLAVSCVPPSGGLVASCDGVVFGMSVKSSDTVQAGNIIVTIIPDDAKPQLTFTLPTEVGANYSPGSDVKATLETSAFKENGTHKRETVAGTIESGILNSDGWLCKARLKDTTDLPIAGQKVQLEVSTKLTGRNESGFVVPIGSIFDDGNGGKCVFSIEMREGLFGLENYLMQHSVTVIEDNGKSVLVTGDISTWMTMANTPTRYISDGTVVWVNEK